MKSPSVIDTRRPVFRFASSGVAIVAVLVFTAAAVWQQSPAVAQTTAVPLASAQASCAVALARSVPTAPTAPTAALAGGGFEAPAVDAPTF